MRVGAGRQGVWQEGHDEGVARGGTVGGGPEMGVGGREW